MISKAGDTVRVLVVDDSAFMRKVLVEILRQTPQIQVVGTARDGVDALAQIEVLRPDVITLDVEMPRMDGLTALREIMSKFPTPVLMLSSLTQAGASTTLKCLELGAIDFVAKPSGAISLDIGTLAQEIVAKVLAVSKAKPGRSTSIAVVAPRAPSANASRRKITTVFIGCSTGGPRALQAVIPALPRDLGVPIVIVQHMPPSFTAGLADRLDQMSHLSVREAKEGDLLHAGEALVAPGGRHMEFDGMGRCMITDGPAVNSVKPSVDVTLASLLNTRGPRTLGILLTGMGSDGAASLRALRDAGGTTFAEDASTCVVYGMPRAAVEMGAVDRIIPLHHIPAAIVEAVSQDWNSRIA